LELKDHICKDESTSCAPLLEREKCGAERKIKQIEEKTRSEAKLLIEISHCWSEFLALSRTLLSNQTRIL
jgi:hypothetical protein